MGQGLESEMIPVPFLVIANFTFPIALKNLGTFFFFFFLVVLGTEFRALHTLVK
jgi:hypothetical protein